MRAAVARGRGQLSIERVPVPEPEPGEVRVRMTGCGVCGTDLHFFRQDLWKPGITPGHEMAGEVDALGDGVAGLATGDLVVIEPLRSCGTCPSCRAGRYSICPELEVSGIHRNGGFAEFVTAPAHRLFRVPEDLDPRLAVLTEPMAVAVHGLRRGNLAAGQRVLVLGAGAVGLLTVAAARALGAGEVWLTARHPHQAEIGASLGAARVLREEEASSRDLDRLGRESPVDLVVETVGGTADTLDAAVAAARPGGVISVVGIFMGSVTITALPLLRKEITLAWSNCYEHGREGADFETAVKLVDADRGALSGMITHAVPLDQISRAFALASDKKAGAVKVTTLP